MRTSIAHRLLAALLAAAAFTQPGAALAHGMAHQREHQHEPAHHEPAQHEAEHHEAAHHPSTDGREPLVLSGPDHGHDHVHGDVDDANVRHRVDPHVIAAAIEVPETTLRDIAVETAPARAPLARGDPATGPPPRLRAPPLR